MNIVVLDGYTLNPGDNPWDGVNALGTVKVHDRTDPAQVAARAADADIILTNKTPIPAETLSRLPRARFISVLATGYDIVDTAEAGQRGIPVSNVPVYGTDSVAQFVFALLLELCHHVGRHEQGVKAGEWCASPDWCYWNTPQVLLHGKKIGIVGLGRIGRRVGELAHAFGMEVLAADPVCHEPPSYLPFSWVSVEELFAEADVVTLHCPQTADNLRFVDEALLGTMKTSAFFINAARGSLVLEEDLARALNEGRLAAAALDVVSTEPIRPDNPLLTAANCLLTPHMAWSTLAARRNLMTATVENIAAFLAGSPVNVVNTAHLKAEG